MKQVLFLVHGMGDDADSPVGKADREAWAKDVTAAIRAAAAAYPGIPSDDLVLVPILYDDVFTTHVQTWSALAEQLVGTGLEPLVGWMKGAADPSFLWGSVGDVVQYRAFANVRSHVATHVAKQIATTVEAYGTGTDAKYHLLAHSLGTAVAHDAIQKLATVAIDGNRALQPPAFRFDTFMALANVSRLVWVTNDAFYEETCVRPPDCGLALERCALQSYVSVRHVADPIPSVVRFQRKGWSQENFFNLEVRHVRDVNVHGFTHYLASPWVTDTLLYRLFGGRAVPRAAVLKRVQSFKDYVGPKAPALATIVQTIEASLNAISAQAEGKFEYDLDDIAKALWEYRDSIGAVLRGA
jgi:hypothetical protein